MFKKFKIKSWFQIVAEVHSGGGDDSRGAPISRRGNYGSVTNGQNNGPIRDEDNDNQPITEDLSSTLNGEIIIQGESEVVQVQERFQRPPYARCPFVK